MVLSSCVVPPSASALIASLRGVGYSLETAIADLIDNSIAAGAKTVDLQLDWKDGEPIVSILDDGDGMSEDRLLEAMRFGGVGPDVARGATDLGRFGLGLKTASLSQCRQLTVASKIAGTLCVHLGHRPHQKGRRPMGTCGWFGTSDVRCARETYRPQGWNSRLLAENRLRPQGGQARSYSVSGGYRTSRSPSRNGLSPISGRRRPEHSDQC